MSPIRLFRVLLVIWLAFTLAACSSATPTPTPTAPTAAGAPAATRVQPPATTEAPAAHTHAVATIPAGATVPTATAPAGATIPTATVVRPATPSAPSPAGFSRTAEGYYVQGRADAAIAIYDYSDFL